MQGVPQKIEGTDASRHGKAENSGISQASGKKTTQDYRFISVSYRKETDKKEGYCILTSGQNTTPNKNSLIDRASGVMKTVLNHVSPFGKTDALEIRENIEKSSLSSKDKKKLLDFYNDQQREKFVQLCPDVSISCSLSTDSNLAQTQNFQAINLSQLNNELIHFFLRAGHLDQSYRSNPNQDYFINVEIFGKG